MVPEQISYSKPILENFIAFRREQNYIKNKDTKEEGNHLIEKTFKRRCCCCKSLINFRYSFIF